MDMPDDGVREWRRSVPKGLLMLLGSAVFVALGVLLVLGRLGDRADGISQGIGCVAVLFFGYAGYRWVRQLLASDPVVIRVGPTGFHDRRLSSDPIPWESIDGFYLSRQQQVRLLVLLMTPEAVRRHVHSGSASRWAMGRWMSGGPATATTGLNPSFDDLVAAVSVWCPQDSPPAGRPPARH
jgi:hypothetical protein